MKATGFTSAKGALNTITWKLVSADERSLAVQGMGWTGTSNIKLKVQKQHLVPGGQMWLLN